VAEDQRVRPSARDIYESVKLDAAEELRRSAPALAFSALLAGATVGFGGLAVAAAGALVGGTPSHQLIAALFYPIGFIAAIVGREQLFTENTLYPVTLVLDERRHLSGTLRLWGLVLAANLIGALAFAAIAVLSGAVPGDIVHELTGLGHSLSSGDWTTNFWSGVMAGWLLALVAWVIEASDHVIGQVALIWALTFIIGVASLDHCVSTTSAVLAAVVDGNVGVGHFFGWLSAVTLGNVIGGVIIVAVLNYGQVRAGE
jgi:formate/nitrite transporter FocA (FNT family)